MQYINNFKDNSMFNYIDFPKNISEKALFHELILTPLLALFAYHMTNIVIGVNKEKMDSL